MKKKKIIKICLICFIAWLGLFIIFGNIDYNRTKKGKEPIMAIYMGVNKQKTAKQWYGLGYVVSKCLGEHATKTYGFSILSTQPFCVYEYNIEIPFTNYTIVDETKSCDLALEEIAKDDNYTYYLSCIKSETIFLLYDNGKKTSIKEALRENRVTIDELIEKGLEVYQKKN